MGAALSICSTYLTVSEEMIGVYLRVVSRGLPFIMNSMPIGGLTGPYGLTALATMAHAEVLFGLVLAQMISPGVKGVHAAMPTIADMGKKDMPLRFGSRSNTLLNILLAELNEHLGIPGCQSACGHSRNSLDAEAVNEAAETYTLVNRYGFHILRHLFGFASQLNDFSIDNLLKEVELYREVMRNPRPIPAVKPAVYDEEGLEAIIEGITAKDFRNLDHTLKNIGKAFTD